MLYPKGIRFVLVDTADILAGLQLADLVAHPSRNGILSEHGHGVTIAPFSSKVIAILQSKYDRRGERVLGGKMP
jgi:hypothetical protein